MKILCVIDHFGSGGAQRQMVNLACGLKRRGHDIQIFTYFPRFKFFRGQVEAEGIRIHEYSKGRGFSVPVLKTLIGLLRSNHYDVVISYLDNPNIYVELGSLFVHSTKFVVSERSSHYGDGARPVAFVRRCLHRLADKVIANSHSHRVWLESNHRWLQWRCETIFNGIDIKQFHTRAVEAPRRGRTRLIAVGRVGPEKNILNMIDALASFEYANGWLPSITWVGRRAEDTPAGREYCQKVDALLDTLPSIKAVWSWLGERADVPELLSNHHALIHPSFYEGLPNVICEALSAGLPVLASDVCDNGILVKEGERGFLFDPSSPVAIGRAIERFTELGTEEWKQMSNASRRYAEQTLSIDRMVSEYEGLFERLIV